MFEEYFKSMLGLEVLSVSVTVLFFVMFAVVVIWIFRIDKKYINKMENLPLD